MNFDHLPISSHWSASNVTTGWLIRMAYQMKSYQVSGQPAWVNSKRYDIEADIDAQAVAQIRALSSREQWNQLSLMVRSLLMDRCKLSVTHVTRELPSYAITATKDAPPKLKTLAVEPYPKNPDGLSMAENRGNGKMRLTETKGSLPSLTNALSNLLGMPVADQTNLPGNYTFTLSWTDDAQAPAGASADPDFDRTLATALGEELGLKLKSTKTPTDTIVVDHIEEPSPN